MNAAYAEVSEPQSLFGAAQEKFLELTSWLSSESELSRSHSEVERELHREGFELLRRLLQAHYTLRGMAEPREGVIGADGAERTHRRQTSRKVETVFGTVEASRTSFSGRGLAALHPSDSALSLPEDRYSHEVRRLVSLEVSAKSYDSSLTSLERTTGAKVPKRQAEELAKKATQDFESFYEQTVVDGAEQGEFLVLSFDGKGVVMRPEHLREATRKQSKNKKNKLKSRRSKGESAGRKRMALVAAVYGIDSWSRSPEQIINGLCGVRELRPEGFKPPRPVNKRVWASLVDSPEEIIEAGFREAKARDPKNRKRWLVLVDGEEKLERLVRKVAKAEGVKVTLVLDFIHALEYLWKAGTALHPEGTPELETWVMERLKRLLEGKVSTMVAGMRRAATRRKLSKKRRAPIDKAAKYLLKRKSMTAYDELLEAGAPIASGVIEGTCRHLINDRLDITGARWSLDGAEAILKLRALVASGDFDQYWLFHERVEHIRNHKLHYEAGRPPTVEMPKTLAHLRLVK